MHVEGGDVTLTGNVFEDNRVADGDRGYGGAVYVEAHVVQVVECTFRENRAANGGAIALGGDRVYVYGGTFLTNTARTDGSAVWTFALRTHLTGVLFSRNRGALGTVYARGQLIHLERCTLAHNVGGTSGDVPSGIGGDAFGTIDRCILAFGTGAALDASATMRLECSNIFGNQGGDYTGAVHVAQLDGVLNTSVDPEFCGEADGAEEFALDADSPCLNRSGCGAVIGAVGAGCE